MEAEELHFSFYNFFIFCSVSIPLLFPCCGVHTSLVVLHPINLYQELLLSAILKPDEHEVDRPTGFGKHASLRDNVAPSTTVLEHFCCFYLQARGFAILQVAEIAHLPCDFSCWLVRMLY